MGVGILDTRGCSTTTPDSFEGFENMPTGKEPLCKGTAPLALAFDRSIEEARLLLGEATSVKSPPELLGTIPGLSNRNVPEPRDGDRVLVGRLVSIVMVFV